MITYFLIKKKIFEAYEPLLVYPMALDFGIISLSIVYLFDIH